MSKTVGNYTLVEKLGQGSYATVYKAHHKNNGGDFAVKVISREKIGSAKLQSNLEQEIAIMKEVSHDNVVRLFGTFTSKNNIYLVLEFCGGGDLQQYIRKHKRLEEVVVRRFLVQLVKGLHFLHSKNIIHRDIKPQNLLLSDFSPMATIKFADFGFAKHLQEASMAQTPCGTPLYMAPEIFEMKEYDAKADVWSIGCVLFEMCTGEPPFKGSNHRELFMNIRSKQLRLPSGLTLSSEMMEILQRILELIPERRVSLDMLYRVTERISAEMEGSGADTRVSGLSQTQGPTDREQDTNDGHQQEGVAGVGRKQGQTINASNEVNETREIESQSRANTSSTSSSSSSSTRRRKVSGDFSSHPPVPSVNTSNSPQQVHAQQGEMRRVRSREKIHGRYSPTSGLVSTESPTPATSSNSNSSTSSAVTPATATMLVKLANSGTSPSSERTLSEQANTSAGGSANKSSAVSKALSFDVQQNDGESGVHLQQQQQQQQNSQTARVRGSPQENNRYLRASPTSQRRSLTSSSPPNSSLSKSISDPSNINANSGAFGRDSDDFVMIDEPAAMGDNSSNSSNPTWRNSDQASRSSQQQQQQQHQQQQQSGSPVAQWFGTSRSPGTNPGYLTADTSMGNVVGGGGLLAASSSYSQQSSEVLQLSECAHRCQYISSIVTAMTKHADGLVKDIFGKNSRTITKELDREAILGMNGGYSGRKSGSRDDDDDEVKSREVSPRHRSSLSSSDGGGYNYFGGDSQLESGLQVLSSAISEPFAFYMHAMTYLQDALQRTVSLKTLQTESLRDPDIAGKSQPSPSAYFLGQLDHLAAGLTQRFDQLMSRAEACQRWIRSDASFPIPEPLVYKAALKLGQEAAVEELLGNLNVACDHYWDAKLLVECVLLSASEAADRRVLQGYAKMFLDQFVVCEKSNTLLDHTGHIGRGGEFKAASPGSNSSLDSHVSMSSNTNHPVPNSSSLNN